MEPQRHIIIYGFSKTNKAAKVIAVYQTNEHMGAYKHILKNQVQTIEKI